MKTLIVALIYFFAVDAFAYRYRTCDGSKLVFKDDSLRYEAGKNSFPSGSDRRVSLDAARSRWNEAPSKWSFSSIEWGKGVSTTNTTSEVWYTNSEEHLDGGPAIALTKYNCSTFSKKLKSVDILMDNHLSWMNFNNRHSSTAYTGTFRPARTTLMHEMGHALGLLHSNVRYNLMGSDTTVVTANGSDFRAYASEDPSQGAVFLYGKRTTDGRDVSVTHWKYSGTSGEYSSHRTVQVYTTGNVVVDSYIDNDVDFRVYRVSKGSTYNFEFTYENSGVQDVESSINTAFYLSTNDVISTGDRLLKTTTYTLARDVPYTNSIALTVPSDLAVGKIYYVGAYVDYNNTIPEHTGSNNMTFVPIYIDN